jgi:hypothetical protein
MPHYPPGPKDALRVSLSHLAELAYAQQGLTP